MKGFFVKPVSGNVMFLGNNAWMNTPLRGGIPNV